MTLVKNINLELFKLKHRYFFLTWLLLSIPVLAYILYDFKDFEIPTNFIYQNTNSYYFDVLLKAIMLLGLLMPISAGVLISKLVDQEHKGDNWKLLLTNNSSFYQLWFSKFLIVFILMELTTAATILVTAFGVYFYTAYPIPYQTFAISFLALSGANVISLTIAEILSVNFKNQLIVLTVSLIGGFLGIISPLMSPEIIKFIPWGYYCLCNLCKTEIAGITETGRYIYRIVNIQPSYGLIFSITFLFVLINIGFAYYKSGREV